MTIPFFDGHNDTLLRLVDSPRPDKIAMFTDGTIDGHLDLPRAKQAGLVGGFFAIFPPPLKSAAADVLSSPTASEGKLPPNLDVRDALASTLEMAALLHQLDRVGSLTLCRTADELKTAQKNNKLGAIFHIEGAEAIDTKFHSFEVLYAAGLRSIGITWSRANDFGTGVPFVHNADPDIGPGLTEAGKELVILCDKRGVMIDLSHLNAAGFRDVARLSSKPLVATHSNVHAITPHARNLTAWQLSAIRESGGVVGLNFATAFLRPDGKWDTDTPLEIMIRHIDALVEALGEDGVALGSDFDGAQIPKELKDVTGVPKLLKALLDKGYGQALVKKIALENWHSVIARTMG